MENDGAIEEDKRIVLTIEKAVENESRDINEGFLELKGKTVSRVNLHGVNCVSLEMSDGTYYMLNAECIFPTLQLYGVACEQCTLGEIRNPE
jgi:hypothetical protein